MVCDEAEGERLADLLEEFNRPTGSGRGSSVFEPQSLTALTGGLPIGAPRIS
jgi:hypothetical protein